MFITPAYAQGAGGSSDFLIQLMPILLMFVIFYFLLLRPQQQKMKAHREMLANLRRGDTIVTTGGIVGKIIKEIDQTELEVEIAQGTRVRIVRDMVSGVRSKTEPVKDGG
ncbi:MAG: preprotein translocase subunit YajC [Hyphomicrobiaceae bacterium]